MHSVFDLIYYADTNYGLYRLIKYSFFKKGVFLIL